MEAPPQSDPTYRGLFERAPVGLYRCTPEGRIVDANPALAEMLGFPKGASLQGLEVAAFYVDLESRARFRERVECEGVVQGFRFQARRTDGTLLWLENSACAVRDGDGRVLCYEGSLRDVTERVRAEEARARLTAVLEATPDFVAMLDRSCRPVYLNRAGRDLLGIAPEEDVSRLSLSDVHPAWAAALLGEVALPAAARHGAWSGESALRNREGREVPISQVVVAHKGADGAVEVFSTVARDISERKRAEEMLRRQAEFSQLLIDSSVDGILAFDRECRVTIWNPAMERASGSSEAEVLGRSVFEVLPFLKETGDDRFLLDALAGREGVARDRPYAARAGQRGYYEGHFSPLVDAQGDVVGGLALVRGRTEQKSLEEQLRQAQKMEAVGRLAGGVAHDFSNMLTVIAGRAELLMMSSERSDPRYDHAEEILRASEKASSLTRQLLAFSRRQALQPRVVSVNATVNDMHALLRRLIGGHVDLVLELAEDLAAVKVDPGQVEQVILNLAVNAQDAMPEGGRIALRTANVTLDQDYARRRVDVRPGPYVMIEVSDTGVGMDAVTLDRIFEPFFTTKKRGTGLGLATVYGIVRQSGGHVSVESEAGRGTTFRVYLPRADEAPEAAPPRPAGPRGGSETLLVVEDEEPVLELTRLVLERHGYRVLRARGSEEALRASDQHQGEIHALLADVVLPGSNGRELAERLRARRPGLKVVYMSGRPEDLLAHLGTLDGLVLIEKPFTAEALATTLREVLDGSG